MTTETSELAWPPSVAYVALDCAFRPIASHLPSPSPASWRGALVRTMGVVGPSPFALRAGGTWAFRLVLWGDQVERVAEWIVGLERAGRRGVGAGRPPARLVRVRVVDRDVYREGQIVGSPRASVFAPSGHARRAVSDVDVELVSPLRICRDGRPVRTISAKSFFGALGRRATRVGGHQTSDSSKVFRPSFEGGWSATTRFVDRMRYSSRQQRVVGLGGVVGVIRLAGCNAVDCAWLEFGEMFGVGKATAMGCGSIEIVGRD
ncbi:MAG: CRISPR system precrRNA processing endoribonuclease RAMP protein Cas6 [Deltaproteobacteria bacterium]|nr:CRISPR system precrRNA processing endoribonuclease RAMP protein Cas6 [Deltaproteobacteria bacterium]